jgi:hypothetical protein
MPNDPPVFTPDNEPYLGRKSVYHFDKVIISCMEANKHAAKYTISHKNKLTRLQLCACEIIPQGISIALSIRELVRQGYLYGASVLIRPLIERAGIISYLCENPEEVQVWERGWNYKERPSMDEMLSAMSGNADSETRKLIRRLHNSAVHGDPDSVLNSLTTLTDGTAGYSSSKILVNPELCDQICFEASCYLIVIMGRMVEIFPDKN